MVSGIEAKTLLGQFLKDAPKNPGVKMAGKEKGNIGGTILEPPKIATLAEVGITKKESSGPAAAKEFIIRNQFGRRNLPYQRGELALLLKPLIAAKAKENQKAHGGTAPGKSLNQKSDEVNTGKELSKSAGISHDTMHKVAKIAEKAPNVFPVDRI